MFLNTSKHFTDLQEIAHAVGSQKLKSDAVYKADYVQNVRGKGPKDVAKSYPEYDHLREVGKLTSAVRNLLRLLIEILQC